MPERQQPTFEDLELLGEVSKLLTLHDVDNVLKEVVRIAADSVGALHGSLFLYESSNLTWDPIHTMRRLNKDASRDAVDTVTREGLAGWVRRKKLGVIIPDTQQDPRWYRFPYDKIEVRSVLCVPLIYQEEVLGIVTLVHEQVDYFTSYHLRLMTIIANQAAVAIRSSQTFNRMESQRRQLEAVLRATPDPLLVLDTEGYVLHASNGVEALSGPVTAADLPGMPVAELAEIDAMFAPVAQLIGESPDRVETWSFDVHSEPLDRDFIVNVSVWKDEADADRHAGYIAIFNDITALSTLSRFKDRMLHLVSHDLRTPLALITGYADMMELELTDIDFPVLREYVGSIQKGSARMFQLLDNLLRVEKIRSSPIELHEMLQMNDVLRSVVDDLEPLAAQKQQKLALFIEAEDDAEVFGDSVLVRQAIENLVSNAIKYTPEGGTITLTVFQEGNRYVGTVRDTGIGIPAEDVPHVFESFFRSSNAGRTYGLGLGLSLVKTVMQQHGGGVTVRSDVGHGSEFTYWLPLSSADDGKTLSP